MNIEDLKKAPLRSLIQVNEVITLLHSERPKLHTALAYLNANPMHSERPKLHTVLDFLSVIRLR